MVQWCMCGDVQVSHGSLVTGELRSEGSGLLEPMTGLSLDALIDLLRMSPRGGSRSITARQLIDQVVVPRTQQARCAYTKLLPARSLGQPLFHVAFSWDSPFYLAVQSILQHLGLPTHLSMPGSDQDRDDAVDDNSSEASSMSNSSHAALESTFVFVDFLCINLWGTSSEVLHHAPLSDIVGTLDSNTFEARRYDARRATSKSRVQPSMSSSNLGSGAAAATTASPTTHSTASATTVGSPRRGAPMRTATGLGRRLSPEVHLFGPMRLDPQHFVVCVEEVLGAELPVRALVLCLDPELNVLGQLIPMHAAWRAMRSRVPIQVRVRCTLPSSFPDHLMVPPLQANP